MGTLVQSYQEDDVIVDSILKEKDHDDSKLHNKGVLNRDKRSLDEILFVI